jgi:hypothetical protein
LKAYGLGYVLLDRLGVRTEVYSEDDRDYLKITSPLDAGQIENLQSLAGVHGWQTDYRSYKQVQGCSHYRTVTYLALIPKPEKEV